MNGLHFRPLRSLSNSARIWALRLGNVGLMGASSTLNLLPSAVPIANKSINPIELTWYASNFWMVSTDTCARRASPAGVIRLRSRLRVRIRTSSANPE
jgi:hypothetical protein